MQGYSKSRLPWARHCYAVQIAFHSPLGRSPVQSHRHVCVCVCIWQSECRPNATSCNEYPAAFLNKQVRKRPQCFTLLAYSPCFPVIPECFQCGLNAVTIISRFYFGIIIIRRSSAVFPVFLAVPYLLRLSREH